MPETRAQIETFELTVCAITGDPGCLGWPDGYHDGPCEDAIADFHRCTECGADDVYGEMEHMPGCSLAATPAAPSHDGERETT